MLKGTNTAPPISATVTRREIIVLAAGLTDAEKSNARGHLFEKFIANLLEEFGYGKPSVEHLNNSANGIELDITAVHELTGQLALAECKAYSSNVAADLLLAFYGKFSAQRLGRPNITGYFIALPGLTSGAREQRNLIESQDQNFHVLTTEDVLRHLEAKDKVSPLSMAKAAFAAPLGPLSDEALLVTEDGLFLAAKELDEKTRLPNRVLVYPCVGSTVVPNRVIALLGDAPYGDGLLCEAAVRHATKPLSTAITASSAYVADSAIVEVAGSTSDFEYQLPASPKFFVGRKTVLEELRGVVAALHTKDGARPGIVVLNAQSGWGKSSLALRLLDLVKSSGGTGLSIDSRTAVHPAFVAAALRRVMIRAQEAKLAVLPPDASFASLLSTLETLKRTKYPASPKPICIFFDQFESVFRDPQLTREFRNLAFGIAEVSAPFLIGFAWKTDLVAFTEGHPYQLRDDIRSRATVKTLEPFDATETGRLITRLQESCGQKIHRDLRERLQEYSQGLPWLFKKLASHILRELKNGVTQSALVTEVLNVQSLFESDLRGLDPAEQRVLRTIARSAPMLASDALEMAGGAEIVQSLVDRRFLVQIGEHLDIYWDIFKDYLNSGGVPLQDAYILRLTPHSVGKLLKTIRDANGVTTPEQAAQVLKTSKNSVFNMARDLRMLGVLAAVEGALRFSDDVAAAADLQDAIRTKAAGALKRHRAFSLLSNLATAGGGQVTMAAFAKALPKIYPAVKAKPSTWIDYARAFAFWFQYAGLAAVHKDEIVPGKEQPVGVDLLTPKRSPRPSGVVVFPRCAPGPVFRLLEDLRKGMDPTTSMRPGSLERAIRDSLALGLIEMADNASPTLTDDGSKVAATAAVARAAVLLPILRRERSFAHAEPLVVHNPALTPKALGKAIAGELRITWADATATCAGKWMRAWLRSAGIKTAMR